MRLGVLGLACLSLAAAETPVTYGIRHYGAEITEHVVARRADGASASHNVKSVSPRTVTLPAERVEVHLYGEVKLMSTYYLPQRTPRRELHPSCRPAVRLPPQFIGTEEVAGLKAFRWRSADGEYDEWFAPELGCREVKRVAVGDRMPLMEVIWLDRADPDPALFVIPEDYRETPPSEVMREIFEQRNKRSLDPANLHDQIILDGLKRIDQRYRDSQRHRP